MWTAARSRLTGGRRGGVDEDLEGDPLTLFRDVRAHPARGALVAERPSIRAVAALIVLDKVRLSIASRIRYVAYVAGAVLSVGAER